MKKTFAKSGAAAAMLLAMAFMAPAAYAQDGSGFEYHGYARAGLITGLNLSEQGGLDTTWLGRLGNEDNGGGNNNFYNETELSYKTVTDTGSWSKTHILFAVNNENLFGVNGGSQGSWAVGQNGSMNPYLRESYVDMGGFAWDPKAVYWVGMKYVERDDVMTQDLYWRNFSGTGFGMTNGLNGTVDLNFTSNGAFGNTMSNGYKYLPVDADLRVRPFGALGVAPLSGLELEANLYYEADNENTAPTGATYSDFGPQFAAVYSFDRFFYVANGFSKLAVQVATQNAATDWNLGNNNGDDNGNTGPGGPNNIPTGGDETQGLAYRVILFGAGLDLLPHLDIMPSATYEWVKATIPGQDNASRLGVVLRPVYKFTNEFSLQVEGGYSYQWGTNYNTWWTGTQGNGTSTGIAGAEEHLTIAPTLSLNSGLFGRPQIRAFYTLLNKDYSLGGNLDNVQSLHFVQEMGVQMETWF